MSKNHRPLHTTTINLFNTVGNVREIVNKLHLHNPTATPLSEAQILVLLNSPLESIIKNILFFQMLYSAVRHKLKRDYIFKLLEKIGLKEQARRYHEWLEEKELENSPLRHTSDLRYQIEKLRPTPINRPVPQDKIAQLTILLAELTAALVLVKDALSVLYLQHQQLIKNLLAFHSAHVETVIFQATAADVVLLPQQVPVLVPQVRLAFQSAGTVQEQIRALGMLNSQGEALNNLVRLQRFIDGVVLGETLAEFDAGLGQLNNQFSALSTQIIDCKMRHADLESLIQQVDAELQSAQSNSPQPAPTPSNILAAEPVAAKHTGHEPQQGVSRHVPAELNKPKDEFAVRSTAPAA